jgi:hypothetical protein
MNGAGDDSGLLSVRGGWLRRRVKLLAAVGGAGGDLGLFPFSPTIALLASRSSLRPAAEPKDGVVAAP